MKRGLYRVRGADGRPNDVRVDDEGIESPVEESLYRARGYLPPADELPWQEAYFSRKSQPESTGPDPAAEKAAREQARKEFLTRFQKR